MLILGLNDGHDSGVALLRDSEVMYAANEERFSRVKNDSGFPELALGNLLKWNDVKPDDIGLLYVATESKPYIPPESDEYGAGDNLLAFCRNAFYMLAENTGNLMAHPWAVRAVRVSSRLLRNRKLLNANLEKFGLGNHKVRFVDHHLCHVLTGFASGSHENQLSVSMDLGGDGYSAAVYTRKNGRIREVHRVPRMHSMGLFWYVVTEACGFHPDRHGGKITGLAAYARGKEVYERIKGLYYYDGKAKTIKSSGKGHASQLRMMKELVDKYGMREVSSAAQRLLEEVVTAFVSDYKRMTECDEIICSGGVFANVKLNQKIFEACRPAGMVVHAHMGDGGVGLGAAAKALYDTTGRLPVFRGAYLGAEYPLEGLEDLCGKYNLRCVRVNNIEEEIAARLAEFKVVCHYAGRSEYGPRALGNRSILFHGGDPSVNDWLNKKMKRSEFMPFAPAVLEGYERKCFHFDDALAKTSEFMTITVECTEWFKEKCPATVHVDGTARPQVVRKSVNPRFHAILAAYEKRTGIPAIINTSFNMHEEPIVETPEDAMRAFVAMGVDYLAIGDYLITAGNSAG